MSKMSHSQAIDSLAGNLLDPHDWIIYTEPRFRADCIPDMLAIKKAYARPEFRIYEVKVQNSDLQGDVRNSKFEKYYSYADRVYFALGPDITCDWKELLKHHPVGVVTCDKDGNWRTRRAAPKIEAKKLIDWELYLALIMNGKIWDKKDRLTRLEHERMVLLKTEIQQLTSSANATLKKQIDEARRTLDKAKDIYDDAKAAAIRDLKADLGLHRWYYGSSDEQHQLIDHITKDVLRPRLESMFDDLRVMVFPVLKPVLEAQELKEMEQSKVRAERKKARDVYYNNGDRVEVVELDDQFQITYAKRGKFLKKEDHESEYCFVDVGEPEARKCKVLDLRRVVED